MTVATIITVVVGALVAIGVFVLVLLRDVASDIAKQEARVWLPLLSRRIVRRAVEDLPIQQRGILEDMEAQLEERSDRPLTMLLFAMRISRDRRLIAEEARALVLEPSSSASGGKTISLSGPVAGIAGLVRRGLTTTNSHLNLVRTLVNLVVVLLRSYKAMLRRNFERVRLLILIAIPAGIVLVQLVIVHVISVSAIWLWLQRGPNLIIAIYPLVGAILLTRRRQVQRLIRRMLFRRDTE